MDISLDLHQQAECQEPSDTKGFEPQLVTVHLCKSPLFVEGRNREREFPEVSVENAADNWRIPSNRSR